MKTKSHKILGAFAFGASLGGMQLLLSSHSSCQLPRSGSCNACGSCLIALIGLTGLALKARITHPPRFHD